jgi:crotonobetainyl-CoA:carnitine CoA-transferase CaiB-like acyl-CoA transferase
MLALDDITVLDLSHALAGPFASTLLGDYGANIIKIEPLDGEIGAPGTAVLRAR